MFTRFFSGPKAEARTITAEALASLLARGEAPVLVDVRSASEYQAGRLPGALHVPMAELQERSAKFDPSETIVFY
jgi:rhodanese-related sulfurtransferase